MRYAYQRDLPVTAGWAPGLYCGGGVATYGGIMLSTLRLTHTGVDQKSPHGYCWPGVIC